MLFLELSVWTVVAKLFLRCNWNCHAKLFVFPPRTTVDRRLLHMCAHIVTFLTQWRKFCVSVELTDRSHEIRLSLIWARF